MADLLFLLFQPANYCGCSECTQEVMDTDAVADYGTWTCKERIDWQVSQGNDEKTACTMISNEFPSTCGPMCHPTECASVRYHIAVSQDLSFFYKDKSHYITL